MYLAMLTLPLLGSIFSGFFGRKVGVSGAQFITCFSVITTTALAILAFFLRVTIYILKKHYIISSIFLFNSLVIIFLGNAFILFIFLLFFLSIFFFSIPFFFRCKYKKI